MGTRQRRLATGTAFLALMCMAVDAAAASEEDVATTILSIDRQFWNAYNACDTEAERRYFTDDVEFYHDKGGATFGADALIETIRKNLCSGSTRVRREAIESTVHVFPLRRDGVLYLTNIRQRLLKAHGQRLRGVVLYGSEVRGEARPDSDIDVLVLLEGPIDYGRDVRTNIDALYDLFLALERPISAKPVDMAAYQTAAYPLYRNAKAEGILA
jgi:predicted nucleotidyltransferase